MAGYDDPYYAQVQRGGAMNFYRDATNAVDGLKYRLDSGDSVREFLETLRGAVRDERGKIARYDNEFRLMNELGVYRTAFLLQTCLTKVTSLTKYQNEERINKQMREFAQMWAFEITLHRKEWDIKDKDLIQHMAEKLIYESMLKANDGFENKNVSGTYNVVETIQRNQEMSNEQPGFWNRWLGKTPSNNAR